MSTRHVASNAFGVISGFLIVPAGLAGIFFTGAAKPAAAAVVNPCTAQLTVATSSATPSLSPSPATTPLIPASTPASAPPSTASSTPTPSPTPTPTPSPTTTSPSPSPSPSGSSPSPTDRLCISVQALATHVRAGAHARYAIWVSLASQASGQAKISITAKPAKLAPSFTVCSPAGKNTCSVGLTAQPVELQAAIAVPQNAAGTHITLTATGTSPQAAASASASGSVLVTAVPTPSASPTPTPGVGAPLPPGTLLPAAPPAGSLPLLPTPVTNPGLAFPKVSPEPHASTTPPPFRVTDVSASFPLDTRLIGDQILGLAVLAAAVTIAVARLSLRKQRPQHSRDPD